MPASCKVIAPNKVIWEMCILPVETLKFHMDKPIMTVATEIQKRWLDGVLWKQHIVLNNNYSYNCISLHHIASTTSLYISLQQHTVKTSYCSNRISLQQYISSQHNRFSHIKNKVLPFYRLNVYCCIYLSSRVNIFWHRLRIRRKRIRSLGSTSTTGGSCD